MTDYEKKETKVIDDIATRIEKLDADLAAIDALGANEKEHRIKRWFEEKKAIYEIKRILHDAGKYAKYDAKELTKIENFFKENGDI